MSTALHDTYGVLAIVSNIGIDKEISGDWVGAQADYAAALVLAEQVGAGPSRHASTTCWARCACTRATMARPRPTWCKQLPASAKSTISNTWRRPCRCWRSFRSNARNGSRPAPGWSRRRALATAHGWEYILPETYTTQAQLALAEHDPAAAQQRAEQAIAIAAELGQPVEEGKAWRVKGHALAVTGQIEAAVSALEQGIASLGDEDPYETARSQLKLAEVLALAGDAERSAGLRSEAEATLHQLGTDVNYQFNVLPRRQSKMVQSFLSCCSHRSRRMMHAIVAFGPALILLMTLLSAAPVVSTGGHSINTTEPANSRDRMVVTYRGRTPIAWRGATWTATATSTSSSAISRNGQPAVPQRRWRAAEAPPGPRDRYED